MNWLNTLLLGALLVPHAAWAQARTVSVGVATFEIASRCYDEIKMKDDSPMGPLVEKAVLEGGKVLGECLRTYSLTHRDKIRAQLQRTTQIDCNTTSDTSGRRCAITLSWGETPKIILYPKSVRTHNPCDIPSKLVIHEILHVAGLPFVDGHHDTWAATEDDPIFGTAAICLGAQDDPRMPYSQCTASLDNKEQIKSLCGKKRYAAFHQAVVDASYEAEAELCPMYNEMSVCSEKQTEQAVDRAFEAVFAAKAKELDLDPGEKEALKKLYIENSKDGIDPLKPEMYTPAN